MVRAALLLLLVVTAAAGCGARTPLGEATDAGAASEGGAEAGPACPFRWEDTVSAELFLTADDQLVLYVNGALVDDTPRLWTSPQRYTVRFFLHPQRRNVVAVQASNRLNTDGLDRGLVGDFQWQHPATSTPTHLLTDASWRMQRGVVSSFGSLALDDSAWPTAFDEGPHGIPPWGAVLGTSRARWLWSYLSAGPASSKPLLETVTFRRGFYLGPRGTVQDAPQPCP